MSNYDVTGNSLPRGHPGEQRRHMLSIPSRRRYRLPWHSGQWIFWPALLGRRLLRIMFEFSPWKIVTWRVKISTNSNFWLQRYLWRWHLTVDRYNFFFQPQARLGSNLGSNLGKTSARRRRSHSLVKFLSWALFINFRCKKGMKGDVIWEKSAAISQLCISTTHCRWRKAA